VPDTVNDARSPEAPVNTIDVADELCCGGCPGPIYLPYEDKSFPYNDGEGVFNVGCKGRCCIDGEECQQITEGECTDLGGEWLVGCCETMGCPVSCCVELPDGVVVRQTISSLLCVSPNSLPNYPTSEDPAAGEEGCRGECCSPDFPSFQSSQSTCDFAGGDWSGTGSTTCQAANTCRDPFSESCCETVVSSAAGLTFKQPGKKRSPYFSQTLKVTVTGTTDSAILIHGTPFGETATPSKRCPINHTFSLCWDEFNVEPVPCDTDFRRVDLTVCWDEQPASESLNFSGCNDLDIHLSACDRDCLTTMTYSGAGHTSNSNIFLHGDATIEANGSGPLVLTSAITVPGSCVEKLTLTGTSTAANQIGVIPNSPSGGLNVEKTGAGSWRLSGFNSYTGQLRVLEGTVVVGSNVGSSGASPFGSNVAAGTLPVLGSTAAGISGTVEMLFDTSTGVTAIDRGFSVAALGAGSTQQAVIGAMGAGSVVIGLSSTQIRLGRSVTLQAANAATARFNGNWNDSAGGDNPAVAFTIGSQGNAGTVVLDSDLPTSITSVSIVNGTFRLATYDDRIWTTTPVTVGSSAGAILDLNSRSQTLSDITFAVGSGTITSGTLRLTGTVATTGKGHTISSAVALDDEATFSGTGSLTISGEISGSYGIAKTGSGTLTLSGDITYTGTTSITGGTLVVEKEYAASADISQATFTPTALTVAFTTTPTSGATYQLLGGATTQTYGSGAVTLTGAGSATATYDSATSTLTID
jgi:autotransporter-associated beta strand protein